MSRVQTGTRVPNTRLLQGRAEGKKIVSMGVCDRNDTTWKDIDGKTRELVFGMDGQMDATVDR